MSTLKDYISLISIGIYPSISEMVLHKKDESEIIKLFKLDYERYYPGKEHIDWGDIHLFPGLLATLLYRIARFYYLTYNEKYAQQVAYLSTRLTSTQFYYSSQIGKAFKVNHAIGTIIGARTIIGDNALFHHNITIGEKNGGRPTLEDNVVVYPGAVIVGKITVGANSVIGANTFIDSDVPKYSVIR